jgi:RimJ/RimL family protein N-acetyltransferase
MSIKFKKISDFNRGIIFELLKDAYSFDSRFEERWISNWEDCDDFYFDNLEIADRYGFITTLDDEPIGFAVWDPRNMPEYAEIGYNCIVSKHKGKGYGKIQLQEAVDRISKSDVRKILVTTDDVLAPAQGMYESVGFKFDKKWEEKNKEDFVCEHIDYVLLVKEVI